MPFPESCRIVPWPHQADGTRRLIATPTVANFDDVGVGKSKQVVDALCELHERGLVDTGVIVTPGFARSVWRDPSPLLGEFAKHAWLELPYSLHDYSVKHDKLPAPNGKLQIVVTNYEFLRRNVEVEKGQEPVKGWPRKRDWPRLVPLFRWLQGRKVWAVFDESWAIENPNSDQAKACWLLRTACQRVTCLNGTPGPLEKQFAQFQILHPNILQVQNFYHFRGRYCEMTDVKISSSGRTAKKITGYKNLDKYAKLTAPFVLRRRAADVLKFLPKRLPPQIIEATLSPREWAVYQDMRDELVAWLDKQKVSIASQAGIRSLRLTQIVSGFLGGLKSATDEGDLFAEGPGECQEIGRSKLDVTLEYLAAQDLPKVVVWANFKPEIERMVRELRALKDHEVFELHGGTADAERQRSKSVFAPPGDESVRAILVGHPLAGGAGLNFSAAAVSIFASNTWSLRIRDQAEGRTDRPGQTNRPRFVDVVAVGPKGQRTVDHLMLEALRSKQDVANWTPEEWKTKLLTENAF